MKSYLFLILITSITIVSCQQGDNLNSLNIEEATANIESGKNAELFKKMEYVISRKTTNGSLLLQSQKTISQNVETKSLISLENKLDPRSTDNKSSGNHLSLINNNGKVISTQGNDRSLNDQELTNLFGTNVEITSGTANTAGTAGTARSNETVYIPDLLSSVSFDGEVLEVGKTISWNVDDLNENGVLFYISYDPKTQLSLKTAYENQYRVVEAFAINDAVGSYTLTQEDVDQFPENAVLNITLMRGNFSIDSNDDDQSFIAISEATLSRPLVR